eukprot:2653649-Rhodomonas_salina.1
MAGAQATTSSRSSTCERRSQRSQRSPIRSDDAARDYRANQRQETAFPVQTVRRKWILVCDFGLSDSVGLAVHVVSRDHGLRLRAHIASSAPRLRVVVREPELRLSRSEPESSVRVGPFRP